MSKIGQRIEVASRYVGNVNRLLDIGCGRGKIAFFLKNKASEIYGVDNSKRELQFAKKNGLKVKLIDLDKSKLPFKNNFFDTVTCLDVIEHVRNPFTLVNEAFRVLKKNGSFILSAPNIRFSDHLLSLIFKGRFPKTSNNKVAYDGGHIHYFTFSDLKLILKKCGFKVTHEVGIINKKKRGTLGRIFEKIIGENFMREFRSPGILIISKKIK